MRQHRLLSRRQWFDHGLNLGFSDSPTCRECGLCEHSLCEPWVLGWRLSQLHRNPTAGPDANKMDGLSALVGGIILQAVKALILWLSGDNKTLSFSDSSTAG